MLRLELLERDAELRRLGLLVADDDLNIRLAFSLAATIGLAGAGLSGREDGELLADFVVGDDDDEDDGVDDFDGAGIPDLPVSGRFHCHHGFCRHGWFLRLGQSTGLDGAGPSRHWGLTGHLPFGQSGGLLSSWDFSPFTLTFPAEGAGSFELDSLTGEDLG